MLNSTKELAKYFKLDEWQTEMLELAVNIEKSCAVVDYLNEDLGKDKIDFNKVDISAPEGGEL